MYEEPTLFPDNDFPENNDPVDETEIQQRIFYYSKKEWKELSRMAKPVMLAVWGERRFEDANLSDLFMILLKERYEQHTSTEAKASN